MAIIISQTRDTERLLSWTRNDINNNSDSDSMVEPTAAAIIHISGAAKRRVYPYRDETDTETQERFTGKRDILKFNISGQGFMLSSYLLKQHPECKLSQANYLDGHWEEELGAYYFDRDPILFNTVLNVIRYGLIQIPAGYDEVLVQNELKFWGLVEERFSLTDKFEKNLERDFLWMESRIPPPLESATKWMKLRYQFWCLLADPANKYTKYPKLALANAAFEILTTVIFMIMFGLSTIPEFRTLSSELAENSSDSRPVCDIKIECFLKSRPLQWIDLSITVIMLFFILDTAMKIIVCPDRRVYFRSFVNWMDLIATVCAVVGVFFHSATFEPEEVTKSWALTNVALQGIQILRVFRILQYASLLDGLMVMILTLKASLHELAVLSAYLLMAMFLFSTLVTFSELTTSIGKGIPHALIGYWWAIITMTTVGYGDYHPESATGYIVGGLCAITGLIMTALPVAVIGSNFNTYWEYNKKRKGTRTLSTNGCYGDTMTKEDIKH